MVAEAEGSRGNRTEPRQFHSVYIAIGAGGAASEFASAASSETLVVRGKPGLSAAIAFAAEPHDPHGVDTRCTAGVSGFRAAPRELPSGADAYSRASFDYHRGV